MPLDVLNELEQAKQGISPENEQLAQSLDTIIEKAKQSSENMGVLRSIVQGLTADGSNLANSIDKVIACYNKFQEKTQGIKTSANGITTAYADMGQVAPEALIRVQKSLQQIAATQQLLTRNIHFSAIDDVQVLIKQVQKLKSTMRNVPKISISKPSYAGKFASGGKVPGNSYSGDKIPILVNSGEYILNQSQMRKLGNRLGGKSPSQVFQYASGRSDIKGAHKGYQAFAKGGMVEPAIGSFSGTRNATREHLVSLNGEIKSLTQAIKELEGHKQQKQQGKNLLDKKISELEEQIRGEKERTAKDVQAKEKQIAKKEKQIANLEQKINNTKNKKRKKKLQERKDSGQKELARLTNQKEQLEKPIQNLEEQMKETNDVLKKLNDELDKVDNQLKTKESKKKQGLERIQSIRKVQALLKNLSKTNRLSAKMQTNKILSNYGFTGNVSADSNKLSKMDSKNISAMTKEIDELNDSLSDTQAQISSFKQAADRAFQDIGDKADSELKGFTNWLKGTPTGLMAVAVGVAFLAKKVGQAADVLKNFSDEMAHLSRDTAVLQSTINTFGGGINMDKLRDELNMTRAQALELKDSFTELGMTNHDLSLVGQVAANLKNTLGQVDPAKLREAVSLIKDLPKQQVQVLMHGTGSFDDKANLMANLIQDGNLDKGIDLMMHGAFGDMQGMVNVPEKDKKIIQQLKKTNKFMEDIKMMTYDALPEIVQRWGAWIATGAKLVSTVVGFAVPTAITAMASYKLMHQVTSAGLKTIDGMGAGKDKQGASIKDMIKGNLSNIIMGAIGTAMTVAFTYLGHKSAEKHEQRSEQHKRNADRIAHRNLQTYGLKHDFTGEQTRQRVNANAQKQAAEWKRTGHTIAAGLDTIATFLAPATGGVSLAFIPLFHIGAEIAGDMKAMKQASIQAYRKALVESGNAYSDSSGNYDVAFNQKMDAWFSDVRAARQDKNNKIYQWKEKQRKQLLKNSLQARKSLYSVDQIVKGKLTRFAQMQIKAAQSNLRQIQMMGGSNQSVRANISSMARNGAGAFSTDLTMLSEQAVRAFKNIKDGAIRATTLSKIKDQEIKIYERFIETLNSVIDNMFQLPSVMINQAKTAMQQAMNEFTGNNFGVSSASAELSGVLKNARQDLGEIMKADAEGSAVIKRMVSEADSALAKASKNFEDTVKNLGMSMEQAQAILQRNRQQDMQFYRKNDEANKMQGELKRLYEIIEKGSGKDATAQQKAAAKQAQQEVLTLFQKMTPELQKQVGMSPQMMAALKERVKTGALGNSGHAAGQMFAKLQFLLDTLSSNRQTGRKRQQTETALQVQAAAAMVNGAKDSKTAAARAQEAQQEKFLLQVQQIQNRLVKQLNQVFNSGAKKFQTVMAQFFDQTWDLRRYGNGDTAMQRRVGTQADLVSTLMTNQRKAIGEYLKQLPDYSATIKQYMSRSDVSPEVRDYLTKYDELMRLEGELATNPNASDMDRMKVGMLHQQLQQALEKNPALKQWVKNNKQFAKDLEAYVGAGFEAVTKNRIQVARQQMKLMQMIGNRITDRLEMVENKIPRTISELQSAQMQGAALYGDYGAAKQFGSQAVSAQAMSARKDLSDAISEFPRMMEDAQRYVSQAIADGSMSAQQGRNYLIHTEKQGLKKIAEIRNRGILDVAKKIDEMFKTIQDRISRMEQSVDVQKQVADFIGAPFEHILELEQRRVDLAQQQLDTEIQKFQKMQEQLGVGADSELLEQQKLKIARAQAEVIKRAWGAQRDALDKMLGKVMGTFQQIGGIFGPNGSRMQARKYGQGYATTPGGQVQRASDGYSGRQNVMQGRTRGETLFASGGQVPGDSKSGDKVMAFVNSGEWVLNPKQMNKLASTLGVDNAQDVFNVSNGQKFASGGAIRPKKFQRMNMSVAQARAGNFDRSEDWMSDEEQAVNEQAKNRLKGVQMSTDKTGPGADGVQNQRSTTVDPNTGTVKAYSSSSGGGNDYVKKIYQNTSQMLSIAKGDSKDGKQGTEKQEKYLAQMTAKLKQAKEKGVGIGQAENDVADAKFRLLEKKEKVKPRWGQVIDYERQILQTLRSQSGTLSTIAGGRGGRVRNVFDAYQRGYSKFTIPKGMESLYRNTPHVMHTTGFEWATPDSVKDTTWTYKDRSKQASDSVKNARGSYGDTIQSLAPLAYLSRMHFFRHGFKHGMKRIGGYFGAKANNTWQFIRHPIKSAKDAFGKSIFAKWFGKKTPGDVKAPVGKIVRPTPGNSPVQFNAIKRFKLTKDGLVPQLTPPKSSPVGVKVGSNYGGGGYADTGRVRLKKIPVKPAKSSFKYSPTGKAIRYARVSERMARTGRVHNVATWSKAARGTKNAADGAKNASKILGFFSKLKSTPVPPKVLSFVGKAGKVAGVIGVAATLYDFYTTFQKAQNLNAAGYERDAEKEYYKFGGRTAGGFAGAWAGAKLGATAGTFIGGPIGTLIGGIGGAIIGGIVGANIGESIGDSLHQGISSTKNKTEEKAKLATADYIKKSDQQWVDFSKQKGVIGIQTGDLFASQKEYDSLLEQFGRQGQSAARRNQAQRRRQRFGAGVDALDRARAAEQQFDSQATGRFKDKMSVKNIMLRAIPVYGAVKGLTDTYDAITDFATGQYLASDRRKAEQGIDLQALKRFDDMQKITFGAEAKQERDKLMIDQIKKRQDSWSAAVDSANKDLSLFVGSLARTNQMYEDQIKEMQKSFEQRQKLRRQELEQLAQQYTQARTPFERQLIQARAQQIGEQDAQDRQKTAIAAANKARQAQEQAEQTHLVQWKDRDGQTHRVLMTQREAAQHKERLKRAGVSESSMSSRQIERLKEMGANGQLEDVFMHLLQDEKGNRQWYYGEAYKQAIDSGKFKRVSLDGGQTYAMQQAWKDVDRSKWKRSEYVDANGNKRYFTDAEIKAGKAEGMTATGTVLDYSASQGGRYRNIWSDEHNRTLRLDMQSERDLAEYHRLAGLQQDQIPPERIKQAYDAYIRDLTKPQHEELAQIDRLLSANPNSPDAQRLKARRQQLQTSISETRQQVDARGQFGVVYGNDDGRAYIVGTQEYRDAMARNSKSGFRMGRRYTSRDTLQGQLRERLKADRERKVREAGTVVQFSGDDDVDGTEWTVQDMDRQDAEIQATWKNKLTKQERVALIKRRFENISRRLASVQQQKDAGKEFDEKAKSANSDYRIVKDKNGTEYALGSEAYQKRKKELGLSQDASEQEIAKHFTTVSTVSTATPPGKGKGKGKQGQGTGQGDVKSEGSGITPPSADKRSGFTKSASARSVARRNAGVDFSKPNSDAQGGSVKADAQASFESGVMKFNDGVSNFSTAVTNLLTQQARGRAKDAPDASGAVGNNSAKGTATPGNANGNTAQGRGGEFTGVVVPNNGNGNANGGTIAKKKDTAAPVANPDAVGTGGKVDAPANGGGKDAPVAPQPGATQSASALNVTFAPAKVTVNVSFDNEMFKNAVKEYVLELAPQIVSAGGDRANT